MALDSRDHNDNRHNGHLCDNHRSNNSHLSSSGLCSNDRQNSSGHHNGLQGIGNCKSTCVGHHKTYCGGLVY